MADIVLGMGTSHGPLLGMRSEQWVRARGRPQERRAMVPRHAYTSTLWSMSAAPDHGEADKRGVKAARHAACQRAIDPLADTLDRVAPDVCIIGDDQHEVFDDDNMPALSVYWGETLDDAPARPSTRRPGTRAG